MTSKDGLCEKHLKAQHHEYAKRRTDKASTSIYKTRLWAEVRARHLAYNPFCARCGALGRVVHHIVEHHGDRDLAYSPSNLETLCMPCHNRAHVRGVVKQQAQDRGNE